jgi:hypothetical protein
MCAHTRLRSVCTIAGSKAIADNIAGAMLLKTVIGQPSRALQAAAESAASRRRCRVGYIGFSLQIIEMA